MRRAALAPVACRLKECATPGDSYGSRAPEGDGSRTGVCSDEQSEEERGGDGENSVQPIDSLLLEPVQLRRSPSQGFIPRISGVSYVHA